MLVSRSGQSNRQDNESSNGSERERDVFINVGGKILHDEVPDDVVETDESELTDQEILKGYFAYILEDKPPTKKVRKFYKLWLMTLSRKRNEVVRQSLFDGV